MEIKEVEELLSVSRSNIRFYEKEGLISPERKENNYRNYTQQDIATLKKVLVLRKLGFSIEEISAMQRSELTFSKAASDNIVRLEKEIDHLKGALEITRALSNEETSFAELDEECVWTEILRAECNGKDFVDICKDYLMFELQIFDEMWKNVFFFNFKKFRKKHGVLLACSILLFICVVRGIVKVVVWKGSFWTAFLYPILIFSVGSIIILPIYILNRKAPKVAAIISSILLMLAIGFLVACVLFIVYALCATR